MCSQDNTVVVGHDPITFELAAILGIRAAAAGTPYWGLGDARMRGVGIARNGDSERFLAEGNQASLVACAEAHAVVLVGTRELVHLLAPPPSTHYRSRSLARGLPPPEALANCYRSL